jgi:long-subunit fatty acid transport protein
MKKILVLIPAFLLAFQISKAQTEKGSQTIGIDVQFTHQKTSENIIRPGVDTYNSDFKLTNFNIGPTYSYFIVDKLDIGTSLTYAYAKLDNQNTSYSSIQTSRQYGANIFLRKYFMFGDKFGLRAGPYLGYFRYNYKTNNDGSITTNKTDNYIVGANLAFVYYPVKKLGISAMLANLSYQHSKLKDATRQTGGGDNVNFNVINNGLGLSIFYVFGGK